MCFLYKIKVDNHILILSHAGQQKVDDATDKAGLTIPNTAPRGQEIIREEISSLKEQFEISFTTSIGSQSQLGENFSFNCYDKLFINYHYLNLRMRFDVFFQNEPWNSGRAMMNCLIT